MTGSVIPFPQQRAVICVRVSPRPADKVKYSPEIQEQQCRDWCAQRGIPVVRVISDILVSGGAANRFASILKSLADDRPTHFVVADLSRWTRDEPKRFFYIQTLIEDGGAKLWSTAAAEQHLNADQVVPFQATLTTMQTEMNSEFLKVLRRKTREGVARARGEKRKVLGRVWGWTFIRSEGDHQEWVMDEPRIRYLYQSVIDGVPYHEIARKTGAQPTNIPAHIRTKAQVRVVGEDMWIRANDVLSRRGRAARKGAARSNLYRGLLVCPCGFKMSQVAQWNNYVCLRRPTRNHDFMTVSATRHVTPAVRDLLSQLRVPHNTADALRIATEPVLEPTRPDPEAIRAELDRLGVLFSRGRLSERVYEAQAEALEAQLEESVPVPPRPPEEQVEIIRTLRSVDLMDMNPETGNVANRLLRELLYPIRLGQDRRPMGLFVREEYQNWFVVA